MFLNIIVGLRSIEEIIGRQVVSSQMHLSRKDKDSVFYRIKFLSDVIT